VASTGQGWVLQPAPQTQPVYFWYGTSLELMGRSSLRISKPLFSEAAQETEQLE
jgi:hypothetical protein